MNGKRASIREDRNRVLLVDDRTRKVADSVISRDEFEREAQRIEGLVWNAIAPASGETVLFCGFGSDITAIERAIAAGAVVSVIESDSERIREHEALPVTVIRGSTSVIPARESAFDLAIAYHYLHEVDPFFHAQVVSELGRVARRIAIVEPSPPSDPLGKRIATLYSRAKRDFGAFEYYQPLDYWRKLVSMVKADVGQTAIAFSRVPPRAFLDETIDVLLRTMKAEAIPKTDLEELRLIARRPGAQLLPQTRNVIVGAAVGELTATSRALGEQSKSAFGAAFTAARAEAPRAPDRRDAPPATAAERGAPQPFVPPQIANAPAIPLHAAAAFVPPPVAAAEAPFSAPSALPTPFAAPRPEPQPFVPPPADPHPFAPSRADAAPQRPSAAPPAQPPPPRPMGFGFAVDDEASAPSAPFAAPFAVPSQPAPSAPATAEAPSGFGWQWEPPEGES